MLYWNNKGEDQIIHLHSLISTVLVRCLDSITDIQATAKTSRYQLVSEAEQAVLSLIQMVNY